MYTDKMREHTNIQIRRLLKEQQEQQMDEVLLPAAIAAGAAAAGYGAYRLGKYLKHRKDVKSLEKHAKGEVSPAMQARLAAQREWEEEQAKTVRDALGSFIDKPWPETLDILRLTIDRLQPLEITKFKSLLTTSSPSVIGQLFRELNKGRSVPGGGSRGWAYKAGTRAQPSMNPIAAASRYTFKGVHVKDVKYPAHDAYTNITNYLNKQIQMGMVSKNGKYLLMKLGWAPSFGGSGGSIIAVFSAQRASIIFAFRDVGKTLRLVNGATSFKPQTASKRKIDPYAKRGTSGAEIIPQSEEPELVRGMAIIRAKHQTIKRVHFDPGKIVEIRGITPYEAVGTLYVEDWLRRVVGPVITLWDVSYGH